MNMIWNLLLLIFMLYCFRCGIAGILSAIKKLFKKVMGKKDGFQLDCRPPENCGGCGTGQEPGAERDTTGTPD